MSKIKTGALTLLCCVCVGLVGMALIALTACGHSQQGEAVSSESPFGDGMFGYSLGAINPQFGPLGGVLFMDTPQDELIIEFMNFRGADADFVLKILFNHQEVDFKVTSYENPDLTFGYIFHLEDGATINIPISLSENVKANTDYATLILMAIAHPHSFQKDIQFFYNKKYGVNSVHYVFFNTDEETRTHIVHQWESHGFQYINWSLSLEMDLFEYPANVFPSPYFDFNVTINTNNNVLDYIYRFPPAYVRVQAGERIEFDFLLGDFTGDLRDKFVIFGLLNWRQIELNGQPFLPVRLTSNAETRNRNAHFDSFVIYAPTEPGMYEFIVYARAVRNRICWASNMENSFRITIVVE